jgi:glycosyltransferase involved in cell wall biosynthesis
VLVSRYTVSGVPIAQLRIARALAAAGHQVDFVIGWVDPRVPAPDLPEIDLVILGKPATRSMFGAIRRYLKRVRPDIVFSAEDHLNTLTLLAAIVTGSRAKISGSSHVRPFDTYSNVPFTKRWVLKQLARAVAWRADALTCVSQDMVAQYREVFKNPRHICVHNIVEEVNSRSRMAESIDDPWFSAGDKPVIVAAGALEPWKGFSDLIDAMALLRDRNTDSRLVIFGEGSLRRELEGQVDRLGLADRVRLPGHASNPLKYFARANVFVLSSLVEGMPTVLIEAMMSGCTPVATDCPTGPREVLHGGKYGYLVPVKNPVALADGIERALDSPIAKTLLEEAVRPFEQDTVLARHFETLGIAAA